VSICNPGLGLPVDRRVTDGSNTSSRSLDCAYQDVRAVIYRNAKVSFAAYSVYGAICLPGQASAVPIFSYLVGRTASREALHQVLSMNLALHPRESSFGEVLQHWIPLLVAPQQAQSHQLEQYGAGHQPGGD
jgi:hypothetical protein